VAGLDQADIWDAYASGGNAEPLFRHADDIPFQFMGVEKANQGSLNVTMILIAHVAPLKVTVDVVAIGAVLDGEICSMVS